YMDEDWDYVITVCDHANETCPVFRGNVKHRLHISFEDPSKVTEGTYEFRLNEYRRIRDAINNTFFKLYCDMEERK
ncbi:MAG: arsenate reductase ArsC, partial [Bacteroidaceae bacterium]|nr:arsenate reductase ArsC [Bacteroidaceae bacterium]